MKTILTNSINRRAPFSPDGEKVRIRGIISHTAPHPLPLPEQERGTAAFTLIELLIAMGIFAIFITIITGVFTNFTQVERHAIAQSRMISDLTSAMEALVKEARTGYGSTYVTDGNGGIAFVNQNAHCVEYRRRDKENNNLFVFERAEQADIASNGDAANCVDVFTDKDSSFTPITSNTTSITDLAFVPTPAESESGVLKNQGVITINLTATSSKDGIPPITIQNSVTSRQMEPYGN